VYNTLVSIVLLHLSYLGCTLTLLHLLSAFCTVVPAQCFLYYSTCSVLSVL
jgi:hypothetical protein